MRIVLLSVALLAASPALANDNVATTATTAATADQASAEEAEKPKEEKICRREDSAVGRVGSKKICLTAEQWKKRRADMQ